MGSGIKREYKLAKELELTKYSSQLLRIETQNLKLIYCEERDIVCDETTYRRIMGFIPWNCAICGTDILIEKKRDDVENFVCDECSERHNNKNMVIDRRILQSRNKLYKMIEDRLY
mgnify:FL=1